MGSFFTDLLSFQHETAVYDIDPKRLRFVYNTCRFTSLEEIREFQPELVINAATVKYTIEAFNQVLPVLPKDCILTMLMLTGQEMRATISMTPEPTLVRWDVVPQMDGMSMDWDNSKTEEEIFAPLRLSSQPLPWRLAKLGKVT